MNAAYRQSCGRCNVQRGTNELTSDLNKHQVNMAGMTGGGDSDEKPFEDIGQLLAHKNTILN
jgi:hypothetical protein